MAEEAIQKFDPAAVVEKLRERVRAMFADVISPEQLDEMIKREFTAWMTPKKADLDDWKRHRYVETPSGFQAIVHSVLEEETKAKLKDWLANSPEWATFWSFNEGSSSEGAQTPALGARAYDLAAEAMAKELPKVMSTIFKSFVASTVAEMRRGQVP